MDTNFFTIVIVAGIGLVMPIAWFFHAMANRSVAGGLQPACNPIARPATELQKTVTIVYDGEQSSRSWWLKALLTGDRHTLIVGRTRAGKSTLAMLVLKAMSLQGVKIAILDPHAKFSDWSGIRPYGRGKKYHEIEAAIQALITEADRRFSLQDLEYDPEFEQLVIFVDEARAIAQNCPSAGEFFKSGSSEYAKIGIRLIILSQSILVKALKFEGEGDLRENFNVIYLGGRATQKLPATANQARPACVEWNDSKPIAIDTSFIPALANSLQADLSQVWEIAINLSSEPEVLKIQPVLASKTNAEKIRTIEILLQSGVTKTEIVDQLYGNRQENFRLVNDVYEKMMGVK